MPDKINENFAIITLIISFFICSIAYNIAYFGYFGDSILYFLYIPISFFDLVKTGLFMILPLFLFLVLFKPILINPVLSGKFASPTSLLLISVMALVCNLFYFGIFVDYYDQFNSMVFESLFYSFLLIFGIGITYYFCKDKSEKSIFLIFALTLFPVAFLLGFIDARFTSYFFTSESKSQILLKTDRIVSAKILRSFDSGIFIISSNQSAINNINFIPWDEIKEVKFKKVSGL